MANQVVDVGQWLADQGRTAGTGVTKPYVAPPPAPAAPNLPPLSFTPPPAAGGTQQQNGYSFPQNSNMTPDGKPNPFGLSQEQIYWALSGDPRAAQRLRDSMGPGLDFQRVINYYEQGGGGFNNVPGGGGYTPQDAFNAAKNYAGNMGDTTYQPMSFQAGTPIMGSDGKIIGYATGKGQEYTAEKGTYTAPGQSGGGGPPAGNGGGGGLPPGPAGGYTSGPAPGAMNQNQLVQQLLRAIGLTPQGGLYTGQPQGGPYGQGNAPYNRTQMPTGMPNNPRNYTGMPLRGFDPSWLINSLRNYYRGGTTTGGAPYSANSMPQGWQGNNVNNWASIYGRG